MSMHQPFPIANMENALFLAKEPWLSPNNAFREMSDANVFRSRIRRRQGFGRFSSCGVAATSTLTKVGIGSGHEYQLDVDDRKFVPESISLSWTDPVNGVITAEAVKDSFAFQDFNGVDGYGWSVVETGTTTQIGVVLQPWVSIAAGNIAARVVMRWDFHSQHTGLDATFGSMTWFEDPELPIVGIASYKATGGDEFLVAMNTTRFFEYNVTEGWFEDLLAVDTFTGSSTDLFWSWPLEDDLLITNGIDPVKKYTGPTNSLVNMGTTVGAGPAAVDSAQLVIFYRNRVIYLNTVESGDTKPRRARWSRAGAFETLDVADFADGPSELGAIVTVEFIADRIMVGFQKGWMELVFTGDQQSLFEFERTTSIYGATARLGSVADGARILARTENGMEAIDPNQQYAADLAIPDYVREKLDTLNAGVTFGTRSIPLKQFWWTTVSAVASSDNADEMLVAQYEEDQNLSWSRYKLPFNCFTAFRSESSQNWDDIDVNWDDYDATWDSASNLTGFPVTLAGHMNGIVYKVDTDRDHLDDRPFGDATVADAASVGPQSIPLEVMSQRLSPFPGMKSHLGWVDFYVDAATDVELTVEFRGNARLSAYKSRVFSLTPAGANEKVVKRIKVNKTALFHTMTIRASGGGGFAIDAIIPWFREAGRMREFG